MRVKDLSISVSRTINLGEFNSLRIEASAGGSVEDETEIPFRFLVARKRGGARALNGRSRRD